MKVKHPFELARAARRKIDADIDKLERRIRSLKTKRNELSPISVLPPEILSKIFIFVRDWFIEDRFHQAAWIIVGHVCHHWRWVALGCPHLWSIPVFTNPDLAQEMIQRSKTVALTIRSDTWAPRMLEELRNAVTQIHRIQSIDLALEPHLPKLKTIFSPLSQSAPLLEDVTLYNPAYSMDDHQFSFPMDALSDAPRLRSINFFRLNCSWESAVFKHINLTSLRFNNDHATTDSASTFSKMMDALHHMPNLRTLALNGSIPSHTTGSGNEKTLEFKFLEQLELSAKAVDCIFLLRRIRYPPCATVGLRSSSTTVEDGTTIFSLISQNMRRTQSVKAGAPCSPTIIRSAQLMSTLLGGDPKITFFDEVDDKKHLSNDFDSIISIVLGGYWTLSRARGPLLTSLFSCFDLSSLQELLLHWDFTHSEVHTIRDTFGKLPKLKFMNVFQSLPKICLIFAESSEDSSTERPEGAQTLNSQRRKLQQDIPPVTVFPALRTLAIDQVDFRYHPEHVEFFIDMLMKRSDMNAPIDGLNLVRCRGVRTWQKRRLRELVIDLEVGGKVIDVKELDSEDDYIDEDEDEGE